MTSDERYAIDSEYRKWRDEEDVIIFKFYEYVYVNKFGPTVLPLMGPQDW